MTSVIASPNAAVAPNGREVDQSAGVDLEELLEVSSESKLLHEALRSIRSLEERAGQASSADGLLLEKLAKVKANLDRLLHQEQEEPNKTSKCEPETIIAETNDIEVKEYLFSQFSAIQQRNSGLPRSIVDGSTSRKERRRYSHEVTLADLRQIKSYTQEEPSEELDLSKIDNILEKIDNWNFDIFALRDATRDHALREVSLYFFRRFGFQETLAVDEQTFQRFVSAIEAGYKKNPYHVSIT